MLRTFSIFAIVAIVSPVMAQHGAHACQSSQAVAAPATATQYVAHDTSASGPDLVDTAIAAGQFKTLVAAVQAADLVGALKGEGPFTVFAPTDEAFAKIPSETLQTLLKPENKDQLVKILTYHVVPGRVLAKDVVGLRTAKTLQGGEVAVGVGGGRVFVNNAQVIKTDVETSNGVIHIIDTVIMPAE